MTVDHTDLISEEYNCMSPGSSQETNPQPVRCLIAMKVEGTWGYQIYRLWEIPREFSGRDKKLGEEVREFWPLNVGGPSSGWA